MRGRLRLVTSGALADEVVHSEFGTWAPAAAEMHAALRQPESRYTRNSGFGEEVTVRATPEAWDALRRWCELRAYTDVQDRFDTRVKAPAYLRHQQRFRKELDRLAKAPAYRGVAVPGTVTTAFLGCRVEPTGRWWPTIRQALEAVEEPGELEQVELLPETRCRRGQPFTFWEPRDLSG